MARLTIEYCGNYAPKELCTIQELFNRLAKYEDMHEKIKKRIEEIKSTGYYPHNFTGQMVEDFERVLSLLN